MTKEHLIQLVKEEVAAKTKKLVALTVKINESNFRDNLQWNRIEDGAFLEFTRDFSNILLLHLSKDDAKERIEKLIKKVELFLLGDELSGNRGPWDSCSSSPGANRLEIIRCDADRKNRIDAIAALRILNDIEN